MERRKERAKRKGEGTSFIQSQRAVLRPNNKNRHHSTIKAGQQTMSESANKAAGQKGQSRQSLHVQNRQACKDEQRRANGIVQLLSGFPVQFLLTRLCSGTPPPSRAFHPHGLGVSVP